MCLPVPHSIFDRIEHFYVSSLSCCWLAHGASRLKHFVIYECCRMSWFWFYVELTGEYNNHCLSNIIALDHFYGIHARALQWRLLLYLCNDRVWTNAKTHIHGITYQRNTDIIIHFIALCSISSAFFLIRSALQPDIKSGYLFAAIDDAFHF